jgi:hypothetical protein
MSEGRSQRSVASSALHRQEAELAAAEERERVVAETAATAARASRLAAAELAAAREEVEAAAAADAARAAVVELKALCGSSISSSASADNGTDVELTQAREAAGERAAQWAAAHPNGCGGGSPDGRGRASGTSGTDACGGRAPSGGRVDGDRGSYRWRGSPSPDRRHGHHRIQAVVRDIGPGGGWPTLTKTNYIEWAAVMRVRLQVRHMWEAVRYGDVNYDED